MQQASSERGKLVVPKPETILMTFLRISAQPRNRPRLHLLGSSRRVESLSATSQPVEASMKRLEVGGSLSIIELLRISGVLKTAGAGQSPTARAATETQNQPTAH